MPIPTNTFTLDDAKILLELTGDPPYPSAVVNKAVVAAKQKWTRKLLCTLSHDVRDEATIALQFISRARDLCLAATAPSRARNWKSSSPVPQAVPFAKQEPAKRFFECLNLFVSIFKSLWSLAKSVWVFLRSVPGAFGDMWAIVNDAADYAKDFGIPKPWLLLIVVMGTLMLFHGCIHRV